MAALAWLARHELRLAWRDWIGLLTAGKPRRVRWAAAGLAVVAVLMHLVAAGMVGPLAATGPGDRHSLFVISASALLSWCLMLSQALESITRAFHARGDLDLLLSSPTPARTIFSIRIAAIAASVSGAALLLAAPFIHMLAVAGGPRWLGGYGVVLAMGLTATTVAVVLAVALFRAVGPKRTRLLSQVVAAIIGAAFVIGIQVAAILSHGTLARSDLLQSGALVASMPEVDSIVWWPARAAMGEPLPLAAVLAAAILLLWGTATLFGERFGAYAVAVAGADRMGAKVRPAGRAFRGLSAKAALRRKERVLLARDPWLLSQTLMQVLYLIPPALLLWRTHGESHTLLILVPILVMAAGQFAGGLAWLAVSGEDAPDLIATAPMTAFQILSAKVEAVMTAVGLLFAPFVLALAWSAPRHAALSALGIAVSALSATLIQLWFRVQAKRAHFRRRQTSSRLATFAEAFSSIGWACTFALAVLSPVLALVASFVPLAVLAIVWLSKPESRNP